MTPQNWDGLPCPRFHRHIVFLRSRRKRGHGSLSSFCGITNLRLGLPSQYIISLGNVNAALSRRWGMGNEANLMFRAEAINLFNTPQFAEPGFEVANQNFGQITNTLNDGRTFRMTLQLSW